MAKPARKVVETPTEEFEYKLKLGGHRQKNDSGEKTDYEPGDKFWSSSELMARDNAKFEATGAKRACKTSAPVVPSSLPINPPPVKPTTPPFPTPVKVQTPPPVTVKLTDEDIHAMTVAELRNFAEENEIDLKGAVKKDDVIKAIKAGQ